ncbi:Uncharacterised protein [BD1-7 clade bacterium]|uniref:CBU-0592-like domain-containing protein n=1 Tax=BD1-7 clade bacterium TaxID=2029982 RepID=A0A5S9NP88_9GAMM|nr:Uncharacterised protein [BD1-7 clade bacterium]
MINRNSIELLGWIGAVLILLMFALNSLGHINTHSTNYQLGNLTGACFIAIASMVKNAWPAAFLNICWALVAVFSLALQLG